LHFGLSTVPKSLKVPIKIFFIYIKKIWYNILIKFLGNRPNRCHNIVMKKSTKTIGSISRRAKFNIFSVLFLLFIAVAIITSINPVFEIISKRKNIEQLESKLEWVREENIKLLAYEKELYGEPAIKREALRQFNITDPNDKIVFWVEEESLDVLIESNLDLEDKFYSNNNLWQNLRIFYNREFKED
jgi:cell division protein FtsB